MANPIVYRQTLGVIAYQQPDEGECVTSFDYEIQVTDPPQEDATHYEDAGGTYSIPASTTDQSITIGTVSLASIFVIEPTDDIYIKFVNGAGTSQQLKFIGGTKSVLHMEFTGLLFSNPSSSAVTGRYFVVGD